MNTTTTPDKLDAIVNIERYIKRNGPQPANTIELPFTCHHCKRQRYDLDIVDGDGYPICKECIDRIVQILAE